MNIWEIKGERRLIRGLNSLEIIVCISNCYNYGNDNIMIIVYQQLR